MIIIVSDIVPPPIGTAVTRSVAIREIPNIWSTPPAVYTFVPNKHTKNIALNTEPIIEPSLWKLVPRGIKVSAISSETPIFLEVCRFTGIDAALEHVASAVNVAGKTNFQNLLTPSLPPAMNAYSVYIPKKQKRQAIV